MKFIDRKQESQDNEQQKIILNEARKGFASKFDFILSRLANQIRIKKLTSCEAAELLDQEAEKFRNEAEI